MTQLNHGIFLKRVLNVDDGLGHILKFYLLLFIKLVDFSILREFWSVRNCSEASEIAFFVLHPDFKVTFTAIKSDFDPTILFF